MSYEDLPIIKREEPQRPFLELPLPETTQPELDEPKPEPKRVIIIDTLDDAVDDFTIDL